jgi:hypothetical protein
MPFHHPSCTAPHSLRVGTEPHVNNVDTPSVVGQHGGRAITLMTSKRVPGPWYSMELSVTPGFKTKTRCSSYVCPRSSCHTYGQNVSIEYQCLYYIVSYYRNLLQVQKGLNNGMDPILPQVVDRGFRTPRRSLHQRTPHLLSSRA